jgi:hypothetical protein
MASATVRDPLADHLITPQNSALIVIDYQPSQFVAVPSMDQDLLLNASAQTHVHRQDASSRVRA